MNLSELGQTMPKANLDFFVDAPVVYHCHHFNLFLDQSINDVFGMEEGARVRVRAARDAARQLLLGAVQGTGARTPAERLELAQELFRVMGHGRLRLLAGPSGGTAEGEFLHYGFSWREKYGAMVRRSHPADAVAAGFAAAAVEVAFSGGAFTATETACIASDHDQCQFELSPDPLAVSSRLLSRANIQPRAAVGGIAEERIQAINTGLRSFLSGVSGDDRGLVGAFGVYVTRHLTNYYNAISYQAVSHIQEHRPGLLSMFEALLRESGHVCVFNTFGGILYSPEWDGLVGRIQGDQEEVISACCAIARSLGFGSWAIKELSEDRLVIHTATEYESPYCLHMAEEHHCRSYFLQGAALAFMRLWQAIDWNNRPALNQDLYNQLFRTGQPSWKVKQVQSIAAGDPVSEVVVTCAQ